MKNELYPIFLKTNQLHILVVGGGEVALEKLSFLLKSSPNAVVKVLSPWLRPKTKAFMQSKHIAHVKAEYHCSFLNGHHMVIATTDKPEVNKQVFEDCRAKQILVNVADNPPLCDFYMGGIVSKGHLKIAISTNGQSPTMAKRLRQWLEDLIPDETDQLLEQLHAYRKTLKGDFQQKISHLNQLTKSLIE